MEKTEIDWCDSTWNPVTGCLHGCEYCYARGIAERFSGKKILKYGIRTVLDKAVLINGKVCPYPYGFKPTFHRYHLNDYIGKKGRNIFVCSMADLFGEWVPDNWIEEVFKACEKAPQHNYLFLTKNPARYVDLQDVGKLPRGSNMWYGVSVTDCRQLELTEQSFGELRSNTKTFFSIEPILEDVTVVQAWNDCIVSRYVDWVIVGAETGRRKDKVVPKREWIEHIVEDCRKYDIPLFMKSSLADIWGEALIQEFPRELRR